MFFNMENPTFPFEHIQFAIVNKLTEPEVLLKK